VTAVAPGAIAGLRAGRLILLGFWAGVLLMTGAAATPGDADARRSKHEEAGS